MSDSTLKSRVKVSGILACMIALLLIASYGLTRRVAAKVFPSSPSPARAVPLDAEQVMLYRGDARRTGTYDEPGIRQMSGLRWEVPVGDVVHGPPVFAGGVIYLISREGRLAAIDSSTGNRLWAFRPNPDSPVFSPVAVANGLVYVGQDKRVYALNAQTGRKVWKFKTKNLSLSAPLVAGSTLYFGCFDDFFYALDANTGRLKWKIRVGDSDTPAVFDGNTVFFVSADFTINRSYLYAVDGETGQQKWRMERPASTGWELGLTVADGLLYIGTGDGRFHALDTLTGQDVWGYEGGDAHWSGPAVAGGLVYVGNQDRYVHALDGRTGELLWKFQAEDWAFASPIVSGGVVYFGVGNLDQSEGGRHFYAVDGLTGQELWKFQASGRIMAAACTGNGAVYFASMIGANGTLYAAE